MPLGERHDPAHGRAGRIEVGFRESLAGEMDHGDLADTGIAAGAELAVELSEQRRVVAGPELPIGGALGGDGDEGDEAVRVGPRRLEDRRVGARTPPEDDRASNAGLLHQPELRRGIVQVDVGIGERNGVGRGTRRLAIGHGGHEHGHDCARGESGKPTGTPPPRAGDPVHESHDRLDARAGESAASG
jgi:hypothetical protein